MCVPVCGAQVTGANSPRKWALLIGIDQYKDSNRISNLGSAAADARAIKKALVEADDILDEPDVFAGLSSVRATRIELTSDQLFG